MRGRQAGRSRPKNPTPTGGKSVLTPADLVFNGFVKFPSSPSNLWGSGGGIAMRTVSTETRIFLFDGAGSGSGAPDQLIEYVLPATAPNTTFASAPVCTVSRNWGNVKSGHLVLNTGNANHGVGGIYWDAGRNTVWWSYGDAYVPSAHDPSIGATILNDGAGTSVSYGPWRTQWTSQRTRGAFQTIPAAFATANTSGANVGLMSHQCSGNATAPFGASLSAVTLFDPTTTAANTNGNTTYAMANQGLILHTSSTQQTRDTNYRTCGWNTLYDCRLGTYVDYSAVFGGQHPSTGENDTMNCCVWVDLADKHGLIYFGQLATTPTGYTAPGPDGFVHQWYGDPSHGSSSGSGYTDGQCCHGQDDPYWSATGPGTHMRVPMGWIYNPDHLIGTASGSTSLSGLTPTSTFQWKDHFAQFNQRYQSFNFGLSGVCDAANRKIYVTLRHDTTTNSPNPRPALAVFSIT